MFPMFPRKLINQTFNCFNDLTRVDEDWLKKAKTLPVDGAMHFLCEFVDEYGENKFSVRRKADREYSYELMQKIVGIDNCRHSKRFKITDSGSFEFEDEAVTTTALCAYSLKNDGKWWHDGTDWKKIENDVIRWSDGKVRIVADDNDEGTFYFILKTPEGEEKRSAPFWLRTCFLTDNIENEFDGE